MSEFPNHVDAIIIGTGLTNSLLSAACSRIGRSVLHLDENGYYGDLEASFTFQQLVDWIKDKYPGNSSIESIPQELIDKSRMFCLDLSPRFLFSNGHMVDLLVKSNVARYHEFKNNIRILCLVGQNEVHVMPCTRNEVFTSPLLSNPADKRRLMKFIEACIKPNDGGEIEEDKPIGEYLEERGLNPMLRELIINSIAMVHPNDTTREACERIRKLMFATEKYGRSPFLFPLYGCGEFPQSFCRMSAVFGGVFCLNTNIRDVTRQDAKFAVTFGDKEHCVKSDMLVVESYDAIKHNLKEAHDHKDNYMSRAILITNRSIVKTSDNSQPQSDLISLLRIPPTNNDGNFVYLIEVNSSALVCPRDLNIVYLWTKSSLDSASSAESDLKPTVERLFPTAGIEEPNNSPIIWKFFYRQENFEHKKKSGDGGESKSSDGLFVTRPAFDDIDYASIISEAESVFKQMCPGEEFLPRAPDPDEIIYSA